MKHIPATPSASLPAAWTASFALAQQQRLSVTDLIGTVEQIQAADQNDLALELYRHWLTHNPSPLAYAIWFNLGVALANASQFAPAIEAYQNAIEIKNDFLPARFNLGTACEKLGQPAQALAAWRDILALDPAVLAADVTNHKLTLNNLGRLLETQRQYPQAEAFLKASLVLDSDQPDTTQHWLHLRQKQCLWPLLGDWPGQQPESALLAASTLSTLALTDDPQQHLATARRFLKTRIKPALTPLAPRSRYGHKRLRIGYLSGDFCTHPVSLLMVELFELHNHEQFEIYGYCWSPQDGSRLRQRVINAMEHFTRIDQLDDEAAALRIRADEIDVLIDLQGLTSGFRPQLLALRPAPIQITYLGFPGTSGHPDIDYLIADAQVVPAEHAQSYSESVLHLPHCFQPSDRQREVAAPQSRAQCGLPEHGFVFCCFNNNYKITLEVFDCWMRILAQVPGSVLWLLADNPWARANMMAVAERHGIDPARLVFAERTAPPIYLARYLVADLFLDTFPFNAGTTANDALWMGLPLLTLSGRAFASRMAASLLHTLGLPTLITTCLADYEAHAIALAQAPQQLAQLRLELKAARQTSPVFDMPRFARDLEAIYADVAARLSDQGRGAAADAHKRFLHVGCGAQRQTGTLPLFNNGDWDEIRQDIDPAAQPDILGSMTDLGALASGAVDAVYSSHNIEHLYAHEVPVALREFRRVLKPDGFVVITCPDLQSVCALVVSNRLTETAYVSPAGPIAPIDILFGHRAALAQGMAGMAHRTGFTQSSLQAALQDAGFSSMTVFARPEHFDLWAIASKMARNPVELAALVGHLG